MIDFKINISAELVAFNDISNLHKKENFGKFSGVYVMYSKSDEVLYVGKSADLSRRLISHRRESPFYIDVCRIVLYKCGDGRNMDILETLLIDELKPTYNKSKTYYRSREYSEEISEISYEIDAIKQEIRYLEQDIEMLNPDYGDTYDSNYDYDGFSLESEIEPVRNEINRLRGRIRRLQARKQKLIMRLN